MNDDIARVCVIEPSEVTGEASGGEAVCDRSMVEGALTIVGDE
ncbi:hypothetical protein RISK_005775 [Rhodopirellula islandica]|uniref:Uncharacterized protein n=1 Tax=Rhodopirellula islandica TaxID=595434 RepID=A0A0J1EAS5_RHOIS|nr:hypothetical protein RISK_005775 [Rhodopirellula islandica]